MDDVVIVPDFFCEEGRFDAYCEASKAICIRAMLALVWHDTSDVTISQTSSHRAQGGQFGMCNGFLQEITSGGSTNTLDLASLPTCARVVSKLCKYFSIEDRLHVVRQAVGVHVLYAVKEGSAFTRVVWLPPHGSD
eukprot:6473713-Amphidinium_carterae.1